MCIGMYIDVRVDMCIGMRIDMYMAIYIDIAMYVDMCVDFCVGMRIKVAYRYARRHLYRPL